MPRAASQEGGSTGADLQVALADVTRFVRQLSHDLRNHLNAAELQSAYINEVTEDADLKEELKRLREMLSEMGASLQRLTTSLGPINLTGMSYEARSFMEDLRQQVGTRFSTQTEAIEWDLKLDKETIEIDPQLLQEAILELFANAFCHGRGAGPIHVTAATLDGQFIFTLREPKTEFDGLTERWGMEPFSKVKHGHYGLGLSRVRRIVEAHGGSFSARYDSAAATLITSVVLPLAAEA